MEFNYEVKIPKERVAVLVGTKGNIKKKIEKILKIKMIIDSKEGDVILKGDDSLVLMKAQNIVKAIGRGFNPKFALELIDDNVYLELIDMEGFAKDNKKDLIRLRSRVIGTGGKARKIVEGLTETKIVIYGKTIGIIGEYYDISLARKAIENLLLGARHSGVYLFLEKEKKKQKIEL